MLIMKSYLFKSNAQKNLLVIIFILICSIAATAQERSETPNKIVVPAEFKSDGCSVFPDFDYRTCCVEHDKEYYVGGNWKQRWRSDKKLYKCVASKKGFHHKFIAPVMWLGVRAFGIPCLPTSFRWGFGKDKIRRQTLTKNPNGKD